MAAFILRVLWAHGICRHRPECALAGRQIDHPDVGMAQLRHALDDDVQDALEIERRCADGTEDLAQRVELSSEGDGLGIPGRRGHD
jgi:hypothetical protein